MKAEVWMKASFESDFAKTMGSPPKALLPDADSRISERLQVCRRFGWKADLSLDDLFAVLLPESKYANQVPTFVTVNKAGTRFA